MRSEAELRRTPTLLRCILHELVLQLPTPRNTTGAAIRRRQPDGPFASMVDPVRDASAAWRRANARNSFMPTVRFRRLG